MSLRNSVLGFGLLFIIHHFRILNPQNIYYEHLEVFTVKADGKVIAFVEVIIHDHFGLDKNDALSYQGNHNGFASWWVLQHLRNYKPFETLIKVRKQLEWYP